MDMEAELEQHLTFVPNSISKRVAMRLRKPNPTNGRSAAAAADDDE
jgi:hypothetical protein